MKGYFRYILTIFLTKVKSKYRIFIIFLDEKIDTKVTDYRVRTLEFLEILIWGESVRLTFRDVH